MLDLSSCRWQTLAEETVAASGNFQPRRGPLPSPGDATLLARIKTWARNLKRDSHAIYLASRDPRVPWYAKALAMAFAAYALSPIDLIPDVIPVIGYLDDLVIVPLGIWLVVSLIPDEIMIEYRAKADAAGQRPVSKAGMIAIIVLWIVAAIALGWIGYVIWSRSG